ncbi:hypothetical protein BDR26DRAFT_997788 [Obelidium mucronatum]|nr:hypothetical protein BDR26DRAFT_997788 [Obelidium mucronatum]
MAFDKTQLMKVPTLASAGVAAFGWLLMFIGVCIAGAGGIVGFELFYLLVVILSVLGLIAFHQTEEHRIAIVAFVAIGFNFLVGLTDSSIQVTKASSFFASSSSTTAYGFIAAGSIFQAFIFIFWIIRFGSGRNRQAEDAAAAASNGGGGGGFKFSFPSIQLPTFTKKEVPAEQSIDVNNSYATYPPVGSPVNSTPPPVPAANAAPHVVARVRAIHPYTANPQDSTELTFAKGQILDVLDNRGKWWKAQYVNSYGSVVSGIIPSNYVELL